MKEPVIGEAEFEDLPPEGEALPDPRIEEVAKEASQRETAQKQKTVFLELTQTKAWSIVVEYVRQQEKMRFDQILSKHVTAEELHHHNYTRGEVAGMRLVVVFVDEALREAEEVLELYREEERMGV